ncbi:3-oxoadipate enol-lactonase [Phenylobacterium sp. VNQ135]|uniref:3-oxoadipate enol-lactonase n=1 Tax=Phenylobacterium sp. VNQ135 TaxID=3400922 RepID=UPI003C010C2F
MKRIVASDGCALAVRVEGREAAPAVLLLHSIGCDHRLWDSQAAALIARRYRVIRPDIRGHGASHAPAGDYTLDRLAQDALEVLDALRVGAVHVVGLSLGGVIAQRLAQAAPERVISLTLANTLPRIGDAEGWRTRAAKVRAEGLAAIADMAMARFFSPGFCICAPGVVAAAHATLVAADPEGYAGCCAALRDADLTDARPTAPTLVVAGARDVSTTAEAMGAFALTLPNARFVELDAGHLSNLEQPGAFNAALLAHLEAHDG